MRAPAGRRGQPTTGVTCLTSPPPPRAGRSRRPPAPMCRSPPSRQPLVSTTRPGSTTPAVSPSWPTPAAVGPGRSWPPGSPPCTTWTTAAPLGPSPTPATVPGSSPRCPTPCAGAGLPPRGPAALLRPCADFALPPQGEYAVGIASLPADEAERAAVLDAVAGLAAEEGLTVLGWRELPVDADRADLGPTA